MTGVAPIVQSAIAVLFLLALPVFGLVVETPSTWTTNVQTVFPFPQFPQNPDGSLTLGLDGNFYGTTRNGGVNGVGSVYKVGTNGMVTPLYSFSSGVGAWPQTSLVLGTDGNFYGTTTSGGVLGLAGDGSIFQVTTNGVLTTIYTFSDYGFSYVTGSQMEVNSDGINPLGLALGRDGNFYGVASEGGSIGFGTVFVVATSGAFNTLYSFTGGADGANPQASLVPGPDGSFYGVAEAGGTNGFGTIFDITTNGVVTPIYTFADLEDGAYPLGQMALGPDGNFYGTTQQGGTDGFGTLFKVTTNGVLTPLYSFTNGSDGAFPQAGLTLAADGSFYGVTESGGGTNNSGTIFEITTNGVFTALYSFTGGLDGANPSQPLTIGPNGILYGTAYNGGVAGDGAVFEITTNRVFADVATFANGYGQNPNGGLVLGSNGGLIGTTEFGGSANDGAIFEITTNGALNVLADFAGTNGMGPVAAVTVGPGGNLYGTASLGGEDIAGTVFELDTNRVLTDLYDFTAGSFGAIPLASLTIGPDGNLYGTASTNGTWNAGTIFQLDPSNNEVTTVADFDGTNGAAPQASLTVGPDGNLYGTAYSGGSSNLGTVFEVTGGGIPTALHSFSGGDGANPLGGLTLGPDGNFYGTTYQGGVNNNGTIFRVTPNGTLTTLYSFSEENYYFWFGLNSDGANPIGNLAVGPDGNLYGVTQSGGIAAGGTAFAISTNGILTPVAYFNNGTDPQAGLTLGQDGNFYGTDFSGGADGFGEVYRLNLQPEFSQQPSTQIVPQGGPVVYSVGLFGVGPFSIQWLSNGIPILDATNQALTLSNAAAGAAAVYSVSVSNFWGQVSGTPSFATVYSIAPATNGFFTLNFIGPPTATTRIWATTDLSNPNWIPIYTNTSAGAGGAWQFTDTTACRQRFYQFSTP